MEGAITGATDKGGPMIYDSSDRGYGGAWPCYSTASPADAALLTKLGIGQADINSEIRHSMRAFDWKGSSVI